MDPDTHMLKQAASYHHKTRVNKGWIRTH